MASCDLYVRSIFQYRLSFVVTIVYRINAHVRIKDICVIIVLQKNTSSYRRCSIRTCKKCSNIFWYPYIMAGRYNVSFVFYMNISDAAFNIGQLSFFMLMHRKTPFCFFVQDIYRGRLLIYIL